MIANAILAFYSQEDDEENASIGILVTNFPLLPVGSSLCIYQGALTLEDMIIEEYCWHSHWGCEIRILLRGDDESDASEYLRRSDYRHLKEVCIKDPNNSFDRIYPKRIDFNVEYPLPTN